jgi:hypothetical protein
MPKLSKKLMTERPLKWLVFAISLLLSANTSFAQGSASDENDEDELNAIEVHLGEPAPFSGQLLTFSLASELSVGVEHCEETRVLESDHATRREKLAVAVVRGPLEVDNRALKGKLRVIAAALEEARKQREIPVYEEPLLVGPVAFFVGVLVAGVLAYAGVWAVGQLRPAIPPAEPTP